MSFRTRVSAVVAGSMVLVLASVGCASDDGDRSADGSPAGTCSEPEIAAPADELTVALAGSVAFVDGTTASPDGHTHVGPLVAEGEAHLHYCLVVANGYDGPATISAIQVLPDDSEEPLAVVEAEPLLESFVDRDQAERVDGGDQAVLELLVPADGPVSELHQRIAYTVEEDDGARDLFLDLVVPTDPEMA